MAKDIPRYVLVTRPAAQAESLCQRIAERGAFVPVRFPTLAIAPPHDVTAAQTHFAEGASYHAALFTSVNAVYGTLALLPQPHGLDRLRRLAIGEATAQALNACGFPAHAVAPPPHTSEALLALPALHHVTGQNWLIVRGEGGRPILADTLRARGAQVQVVEVYRRIKPTIAPALLHTVIDHGIHQRIAAILMTSQESLRNLIELLPTDAGSWLYRIPLIVISHRLALEAQHQGFHTIQVATAASDTALLQALDALDGRADRPTHL